MKDIIIQQCREVTAMGVIRIRKLCVQGYIDRSGVSCLKHCVGRHGLKGSCKTANLAITNRAAQVLRTERDYAERGPPLVKSRG